jgi:hypothetical protein
VRQLRVEGMGAWRATIGRRRRHPRCATPTSARLACSWRAETAELNQSGVGHGCGVFAWPCLAVEKAVVRCRPSMLGVGDMEGRLWSDSCRCLAVVSRAGCSVLPRRNAKMPLWLEMNGAGYSGCGLWTQWMITNPASNSFHQDIQGGQSASLASRSRRVTQGICVNSIST